MKEFLPIDQQQEGRQVSAKYLRDVGRLAQRANNRVYGGGRQGIRNNAYDVSAPLQMPNLCVVRMIADAIPDALNEANPLTAADIQAASLAQGINLIVPVTGNSQDQFNAVKQVWDDSNTSWADSDEFVDVHVIGNLPVRANCLVAVYYDANSGYYHPLSAEQVVILEITDSTATIDGLFSGRIKTLDSNTLLWTDPTDSDGNTFNEGCVIWALSPPGNPGTGIFPGILSGHWRGRCVFTVITGISTGSDGSWQEADGTVGNNWSAPGTVGRSSVWRMPGGTLTGMQAPTLIFPVVLWSESGFTLTNEDPDSLAVNRFHLAGGFHSSQSGNFYNGAPFITGISTTGMFVGMPISATEFAAGTTITAINSSSRITLSSNATSGGFSLNTTGDTHNGTTTLDNLASTTGVLAGFLVIGNGIPEGTTVVSVDSSTQVTLDTPATASNASTSIWFLGNPTSDTLETWSEHDFLTDDWAWSMYDTSMARWRVLPVRIQVKQLNPSVGPYSCTTLEFDASTYLIVAPDGPNKVKVSWDKTNFKLPFENEFEGSTYQASTPIKLNDNTGITGWPLSSVNGPLTDIRMLAADLAQWGVVTTTTQQFAGPKYFQNGIITNGATTGGFSPTAAIVANGLGVRAGDFFGDVRITTADVSNPQMEFAGKNWTASDTAAQCFMTYTNFDLFLTGSGVYTDPHNGSYLRIMPGRTMVNAASVPFSNFIDCAWVGTMGIVLGTQIPLFQVTAGYALGGGAALVTINGGQLVPDGSQVWDSSVPLGSIPAVVLDTALGWIFSGGGYTTLDYLSGLPNTGKNGLVGIDAKCSGGIITETGSAFTAGSSNSTLTVTFTSSALDVILPSLGPGAGTYTTGAKLTPGGTDGTITLDAYGRVTAISPAT